MHLAARLQPESPTQDSEAPVSHLDLSAPKLDVAWQSAWEEFRDSLCVAFTGPPAPSDEEAANNSALRIEWIQSKTPGHAMVASSLWHVAAILIALLPIWGFLPHSRQNLAPVPIELTWYPPSQDLPHIKLPGAPSKPSPPGDPAKPMPRLGADAYHPRQTILSNPVRVTHPRQTLIQPDAPPVAPKIEPQLPNIVQWTGSVQRPKMRIAPTAAAPKMKNRAVTDVAVPELANSEKNRGPLNIASSPIVNQQPQMPVTPMSAAVPTRRESQAEAVAAPEVGAVESGGDANLRRIIALSATPAPPSPGVEVPQGNLAARVAISPEGGQPGVPGGAANGTPGNGGSGGDSSSMGGTNGGGGGNRTGGGGGGNGGNGTGISISGGGNPTVGSGGVAPAHRKLNLNATTPLGSRPAPAAHHGPASVANFDPSLPPEKLLSGTEIYTLHVDMPNFTSATGSWILKCAQLDEGEQPYDKPRGALSGPVLVQKVDPKYPPDLVKQHVEGELILYAIIRKDGSVDSVQVVKSLEPQLDRNAMEALAKWKFRPGTRDGAPVDLEAVARIPFHFRAPADY
jgi:TonB family protein